MDLDPKPKLAPEDLLKEFESEFDSMAQDRAREVELFGPPVFPEDIDPAKQGHQARAEAVVKKNRRDAAMAAYARGEADWATHLNPPEDRDLLSQVVTPVGGNKVLRLKSQRDTDRQHLRAQLVKAHRRAKEKDDMTLVYQPWINDVEQLYIYAGPRPSNDMSYQFMTEDTAGPFAPGNVKWMSHDDQLLRLKIRTIEYDDGVNPPENITLAELAKRTGLSVTKIRARYDAGVRGSDLWSGRNLGAVYAVDVAGHKMTLAEVSKAWGINVSTLRARYQRGLRGKDLIHKGDMREKAHKENSDE